MKKLTSILILFAILLSLGACGAQDSTPQTTEASAETTAPTEAPSTGLHELTPEQMFGHINQLEPVNGVYQIWNAEGVKNIANHPDADFELLCNVDMGGATIAPIGNAQQPFTGDIKGSNFTISNFTLQGEGDSFGFVAVNNGIIRNLLLDQVTFLPGSSAKYIGTLAGVNGGTVQRCTVGGTMEVASAAADALCGALVGSTTGDILNTISNVDISYTATGAATVAGIAGSASGCRLEFLQSNGKLEITGSDKRAALFVGDATELQINTLVFVGSSNTQDGKLFTNHFCNEQSITASKLLVRDNSREPEKPHIEEKRQKVVDYMNAMATIEWKLRDDLVHSCTCQLSGCHGTFGDEYTYFGPPYNHKGSSLYRMQYCIDEEGYLKDFVQNAGALDGYDMYIGSDCSSATLQALLTVGTEVCFTQTQNENPYWDQYGVYQVGEYESQVGQERYTNGRYTEKIIEYNGPEVLYEAYSQIRKGDFMVYATSEFGYGHSRLCTSDAVVVRDETGKIDPQYSYILMTEQGFTTIDDVNRTFTSWLVDYKYTFNNLFEGYYLPLTIKEFITGEFEEIDCRLEGGISDSRLGLTTGTIVSNYSIDSVSLVITDENDQTVYDHRLFTTVSKTSLDGSTHSRTRAPYKEFNLTNFATPLMTLSLEPGASYHATITCHLATGDELVMNDFTFQNGNAQ